MWRTREVFWNRRNNYSGGVDYINIHNRFYPLFIDLFSLRLNYSVGTNLAKGCHNRSVIHKKRIGYKKSLLPFGNRLFFNKQLLGFYTHPRILMAVTTR